MLGFRTGVFGLMAAAAAPGWSHTITTVDSGGVGQYTSAVYGPDGLALISYYDQANGDLKVARCNDVACTTSTKSTLDSGGDVGRSSSIAIGANGLGIISYLDVTNGLLKVARCADAVCTSASVATLSGVGPAGEGTDIAVPPDRRPVIAFGSGGALRLARCVDAVCTDATAVTVTADFGRNPSVAIGGDALPLVAGNDTAVAPTQPGLRVAHCNDAACGTATFVDVPGQGLSVFYDPTLATSPGGLGVVAYASRTLDFSTSSFRYGMVYRRCVDSACSALTAGPELVLDFYVSSLPEPSLAVRADGRPLVAGARGGDGGRLRIGNCYDPTCAGVLGMDVDGPGAGRFSSVAIGPAGIGLVAYHSSDGGGRLKTAYLDGPPEVADIAFDLIGPINPVALGDLVTYRQNVHNWGPGTARYVTATHVLPPEVTYVGANPPADCSFSPPDQVTCRIGDVGPGGGAVSSGFFVRVESVGSGSITITATGSTLSSDPNLANNTDSHTIPALPALRVASPQVVEGDSGLTEGRFDVELAGGLTVPLTVTYATSGGNAQPTADYLPVSGSLTFTPAAPTQSVTVSVVGDLATEGVENFFLQLAGAAVVVQDDGLRIVDDDPWGAARAALAHGVTILGDLAGSSPTGPEDLYALEVPANASFEVVVDGISGDLQPLSLQLLDLNGFPIVVGQPSPSGGSVRMTRETGDLPELNHTVRIRSGACTTCGPDDVYRVRAYETTVRVPRFNNSGSQATILLVHNATDATGAAAVDFWSPQGQRVGLATLSLPPHGLAVMNTALHVPGQSGSITIRHGFSYGALRGKAVALEPATGFSFDTPLEYRPR